MIVGNDGIIFAEVKVDSFSKFSPEQTTWMHKIMSVMRSDSPVDYQLWYEGDLVSGFIERTLDRMM